MSMCARARVHNSAKSPFISILSAHLCLTTTLQLLVSKQQECDFKPFVPI